MGLLFPPDRFFIIAGPCVVEDDALNMRVATELARLQSSIPGGIVFKASFDKANRSTRGAARGPGFDEGLAALGRVRAATGLRVLTDVHLPAQCAPTAEVVDALQIPAFLCRQTDLLTAAGATAKPVNVKKGQWLQPEAMRGAVDKVRAARPSRSPSSTSSNRPSSSSSNSPASSQSSSAVELGDEVAVTERGTFFGYGDLVVDMRSFVRMRDSTSAPVIFDATHSVQRPGMGEGGSSGGAREFIPHLAMAAVAAGAQGVFIETHPDPDHAPSDGPNMLPLSDLENLLQRLVGVWERVNK